MKAIKWLDEHLEESLLFILFTIMVIVSFLQVIMRYVFENSLSWSEELSRYCFIWLVYIGISYGVKKQNHIKMDLLLTLFKEKGQFILGIVANVFFLIFSVYILIYGIDISVRFIKLNQTSPALNIPIGFVYMAAPVGMGLTIIRIIQDVIQSVKSFKKTKNVET